MRIFLLYALISSSLFCMSCNSKENAVVAKVGDRVITVQEYKSQWRKVPDTSQKRTRKEFLDFLVFNQKIIISAKQAGIANLPEYDQISDTNKEPWLVQKYIAKFAARHPVADADIAKFYEQNRALFGSRSEPRIRHILVKSLPDASKAVQRLAVGESFAKVAASMSADSRTASNGGEIPDVNYLSDPSIQNVIKSLADNQVSNILSVRAGYEVLKKDGSHIVSKPLEQVRPMIEARILGDRILPEMARAGESIKVEINEPILNSIDISTLAPS